MSLSLSCLLFLLVPSLEHEINVQSFVCIIASLVQVVSVSLVAARPATSRARRARHSQSSEVHARNIPVNIVIHRAPTYSITDRATRQTCVTPFPFNGRRAAWKIPTFVRWITVPSSIAGRCFAGRDSKKWGGRRVH